MTQPGDATQWPDQVVNIFRGSMPTQVMFCSGSTRTNVRDSRHSTSAWPLPLKEMRVITEKYSRAIRLRERCKAGVSENFHADTCGQNAAMRQIKAAIWNM